LYPSLEKSTTGIAISEYPPEGKLVNPTSLQWDGIMYEIVMLYTDLLRFLRNIYIVWAKYCNKCIAEKAHKGIGS
jgi:hypothetical protein